jgi:hypothetical protein
MTFLESLFSNKTTSTVFSFSKQSQLLRISKRRSSTSPSDLHWPETQESRGLALTSWHVRTWVVMISWYLDTKKERTMARKNMTLRLPIEQADELEAVARAEGISVSDAVREAITEHIERKRKDKAFRERLRSVMERDRDILERLSR